MAREPVPDVHTYIRLKTGRRMDERRWHLAVCAAEPLGMPVNRTFVEGRDMGIACDPVESFIVPGGDDPQAFKEQLIDRGILRFFKYNTR